MDGKFYPDEFRLGEGAPFAKIFETPMGQILATLESNDDDNACLIFRYWTADGVIEATLAVSGGRAPQVDEHWQKCFAELDTEKVAAVMQKFLAEVEED